MIQDCYDLFQNGWNFSNPCQYGNNLVEPEYALDIKAVVLFPYTGPGKACYNCSERRSLMRLLIAVKFVFFKFISFKSGLENWWKHTFEPPPAIFIIQCYLIRGIKLHCFWAEAQMEPFWWLFRKTSRIPSRGCSAAPPCLPSGEMKV